jgi:uncharacterized membrane protein YoaK (UPF0700 family)
MSPNSVATIAAIDRIHSDRSHRDWLVFMLSLSSGAVDAISFLALGKVFTAAMTGNFALLGLGITGNAGAPSVISVLASMAGCVVGNYVAARIAPPFSHPAVYRGEQPRVVVWPHRTTRALGVSLLAHLCFVVIWFATRGGPDVRLALLAVWALAMGMQSAAVRSLDIAGVFTTAATATLIYLVGDFANRPVSGEEKRRLMGVLVSMAIGATAGGLLLIHAPTYAPLLPFAVTVAVVAIAAKAFGRRDNSQGPP